MSSISSGNEKNPVYFSSGKSEFSASDPVMIWYKCGDVKGVHPNANEDFDRDMIKGKPSNLEYPKGITIYSEDPEKNAFPKIIGKINKDFDFRVGGTGNGAHRLDIAQAGYLDNITSSKLYFTSLNRAVISEVVYLTRFISELFSSIISYRRSISSL